MRIGASSLVLAALVLSPAGAAARMRGPYVGTTVPVKGKVTYKGKPLTQGQIVLRARRRRPRGPRQHPAGRDLRPHHLQGRRRRRPRHPPGCRDVRDEPARMRVPLKYKNPSSSKTEVEVAEGKTEYTIDLK